ncbi:MAG: flagellar basal body rod protein FlgC [Chloroflexi bacterium]|nr:flagellar basal body rod protein FlgC [Chloroflexota bacterium]
MSVFNTFSICGSALTAQRLRMDVISSNIANAETTHTPEGGPYRRRQVHFAPVPSQELGAPRVRERAATAGVAVERIVTDERPPRLVLDPEHPDADTNGYVAYPNVDIVTEMVDLLSATRAYEANITVVNTAKTMAQRAMEIGGRG